MYVCACVCVCAGLELELVLRGEVLICCWELAWNLQVGTLAATGFSSADLLELQVPTAVSPAVNNCPQAGCS